MSTRVEATTMAMHPKLPAGTEVGRWKVIGEGERPGYLRCRCKCGTVRDVQVSNLITQHSKSCGCTRRAAIVAASKRHGQAAQPTHAYAAWQEMKKLCADPGRESYEYFGGRGIKLHAAWEASFEKFIAAVGEPKRKGLVLGRINKRRGFMPGNLAWMTTRERQRGKRDARLVTIDGVTKQLQDWADEYGLKKTTLHWRLKHWPEERWLEPPSPRGTRRR